MYPTGNVPVGQLGSSEPRLLAEESVSIALRDQSKSCWLNFGGGFHPKDSESVKKYPIGSLLQCLQLCRIRNALCDRWVLTCMAAAASCLLGFTSANPASLNWTSSVFGVS